MNLINIIFSVIISFFLMVLPGCATTKRVNIPILAPCASPRLPDKPRLPIYELNKDSPLGDVLKAYVASAHALNNDNNQIRWLIDGKE